MVNEQDDRWTAVRRDAAPIAFVALIWLVQSWLLASMVHERTVNIPFMDDWEMVPALTGNQPITLRWLWSQHNEHRIFLPRIVYMALLSASGTDFRAGAFFNVFALVVGAAALCFAARRLRGSTLYSDAFFPLVVLQWGQVENLTWSFQVQSLLGTVPVLLVLGALFQRGSLSYRQSMAVGAVALALPLCGANGLALVPALAACTLLSAYQLYVERPADRRAWLSVLGIGLASLALTGLYFVGYHKHQGHAESHELVATLVGTLQFLSISFGQGSRALWPATGYLTVALLVATLVALIARLVRCPSAWPQVARIALLFGGVLCLAGGIAWARVAMFPGGLFVSRYCTLGLPLSCGLYLAWEALQNQPAKRFVQMLLFTISAVLVILNREHGFAEAEGLWIRKELVLVDVRNGVPLSVIAEKHCWAVYLCGVDLNERMQMLRKAKVGEFAKATE